MGPFAYRGCHWSFILPLTDRHCKGEVILETPLQQNPLFLFNIEKGKSELFFISGAFLIYLTAKYANTTHKFERYLSWPSEFDSCNFIQIIFVRAQGGKNGTRWSHGTNVRLGASHPKATGLNLSSRNIFQIIFPV